jgi:hypothetical protein
MLVPQVGLEEHEPPAQPAQCHENVRAYVARHPNCRPVRGWLIGDHCTFVYFNAHSLVEAEDGRLIDITPSQPPCPFLRHPGSDEEFRDVVAATPRIRCDVPAQEWPDLSGFAELVAEDLNEE